MIKVIRLKRFGGVTARRHCNLDYNSPSSASSMNIAEHKQNMLRHGGNSRHPILEIISGRESV